MGFVIKFTSKNKNEKLEELLNYKRYSQCGYWTGKDISYEGEFYPICTKEVKKETKFYKIERAGKKKADACVEKYRGIESVEVEENNEFCEWKEHWTGVWMPSCSCIGDTHKKVYGEYCCDCGKKIRKKYK